ncbi:pantoate--beta-alanine ligase [Ilumatobacter nonamiensis]|uniref:pantoate--beta-alanine ligase n=1 Tax=Ilumatobacter nonamiensis TaxID=467093 RepID=UPI00058D8CC5|nr:pantoate--beta-alanine ligase [Ilumatobacter nonamiensis]
MLTITDPSDMRVWSNRAASTGRTIGFVPTMGALHEGHLALIAEAAERCDAVVVSIFVNPLQFNETTDFDSYPRPIDDDIAVCSAAGVSAVYAPTARAMYPEGFQTRVVPGALADRMEGPGRPGHFEGVVTVVAKLFGAVRPDAAIFGQKDFQQLAIVTAMAADLDMGIEIVGHPIVREPDGLAMSSRNVRLTPTQRSAAVCVPRSLDAAISAAGHVDATAGSVTGAAAQVIAAEPLARLEYSTVFDADTLEEFNSDDSLRQSGADRVLRIATAVWFDDVRLIDNRPLAE